jgi:hypothetical protein
MGLLKEFANKYRTISIVGMAKNSGKTTTLNYFIEEAMDEGLVIGVTSTGRDGEATDLVTQTEKPKVYLYTGTFVSLPTKLYEMAEAGLEILEMTNYRTPLGPLLLCRVVESGNVQIAGPVNTKQHKELCEKMMNLGAQLILIDGAIDRKSIAAPETSDGVILATGAVLSRSLKKVVEETAHIVGLYGIPELNEKTIIDLLKASSPNKIILIDEEEAELVPRALDLKTGLTASRILDDEITEKTRFVYLPGALTTGVIEDIYTEKFKRVVFLLKDPTKIFIQSQHWQQLRKKGFQVKVLENINVLAVTVNPTAPSGYAFGHEEFSSAMKGALPDLPIIDVRR